MQSSEEAVQCAVTTFIGVIALSEALAVNTSVEHLDLRHNHVNAAGLMALACTCEHSSIISRVLVDSDTVCQNLGAIDQLVEWPGE